MTAICNICRIFYDRKSALLRMLPVMEVTEAEAAASVRSVCNLKMSCNHRGSHQLPVDPGMGPFFGISALPVFISTYLGCR